MGAGAPAPAPATNYKVEGKALTDSALQEVRCWRCYRLLAYSNIVEGEVVLVCKRCHAKNVIKPSATPPGSILRPKVGTS